MQIIESGLQPKAASGWVECVRGLHPWYFTGGVYALADTGG